jgi:hypothetical protein
MARSHRAQTEQLAEKRSDQSSRGRVLPEGPAFFGFTFVGAGARPSRRQHIYTIPSEEDRLSRQ